MARDPLQAFDALVHQVETEGACSIPGVHIKYETFVPCMWRAVERGFVDRAKAQFVADGLLRGFTLGVDHASLCG